MARTLSQRVRDVVGDQFGASIVEESIEKALKAAKESALSAGEPQSVFYDPLSMFMGREWMAKADFPLQFSDLRAMSRNPIIGSIIQTRIAQIASFCKPQQTSYDFGYKIVSDDLEASKDTARMKEISDWVFHMGIQGYGEKTLEDFARKFMRDSLILDQAAAEVIPMRNRMPAYAVVLDGGSIRRLPASLHYATPFNSTEELYAQVINDQIVTRYNASEMIYGVRNPQTDIRSAGYGLSELELLIRTITTMLNTEKLNSGQVSMGGVAKGVFVVKGDSDKTQFDSFKRDFREAIRNAASYWRPPVLQVGKDANIDWVELDRNNRDMEFSHLLEYLVKTSCGVYQMDPTEINWTIGSAGVKSNFESNKTPQQKASKEKGLKPLLSFLANTLTLNVIHRMDPRYRMEFHGLDVDRETDSSIRKTEVENYKTVNEQRVELGLPAIVGGDVILNQFYVKNLEGTGLFLTAGRPEESDLSATSKGLSADEPTLEMLD